MSGGLNFRLVWWREYANKRCGFENDSGLVVFSNSLLTAIVKNELKFILEFAKLLAAQGVRVIAVESPLPFLDDPVLEGANPFSASRIERACREIAIGLYEAVAVDVVRLPKECSSSSGFTPDIFHRSNAPRGKIHANAAHGSLLVKEVLRCLN